MKAVRCSACALLTLLVGCYGPNREPGDNPNRADESPMEGRPKSEAPAAADSSPPQSTNAASATDPGGVIPPPPDNAKWPAGRDRAPKTDPTPQQ
jgi:hypothetical protein